MTENQKLREALQVAEACLTNKLSTRTKHEYALDVIHEALALRPEQVPMTCEPGEWNSIQIASWIGSKLMHEPPMFERATVCKFVRSLGRHPTLLKHSPKSHPAPSVPTADHLPDAGKMVNGLTKAETDASASVSGLTAAPVGERERFEAYFAWSRKSKGANRRPNFERFEEDGTYKDDHTQRHWWTWQQALIAGDAVDAQRYRWLMDNCTLGIKQNGVGWSLNTSACVAPDCIKDVGDAIDAAMRKEKP